MTGTDAEERYRLIEKDLNSWIQMYLMAHPDIPPPLMASSLAFASHKLNYSEDKAYSIEMMEGDIHALNRLLKIFKENEYDKWLKWLKKRREMEGE